MNKHKLGASGIRGIFKSPYPQRPWGAKIRVNRADKFLGYFATIDEAKAALDAAQDQVLTGPSIQVTLWLLERDHPSLFAELVTSANERIRAAQELGCSPLELPDGWDLA